ncbi:MAG: hypothetical protein ACLQVF_08955 [Isosphaeraceae bacterium]
MSVRRSVPPGSTARTGPAQVDRSNQPLTSGVTVPVTDAAPGPGDMPVGVAIASDSGQGGTVTARRAGGLRDMGLEVSPQKVGVPAALQHLAKAINIAFQTDFGENYLESVYQAAIVRRGEVYIIHREYFGFGDNWFGQFGRLIRSLQLTLEGPDPASPEGQERIREKGPATIRGILNLIGRKLDLVAEYEDRVPAYVEQTFDRLEASGIINGWDRDDWEIWTTRIGLDIRIAPKKPT